MNINNIRSRANSIITWNSIDLHQSSIKDCRIALAQIEVSVQLFNDGYQFKKMIVDKQEEKILNLIDKATKEKVNIIVFPECSIPRKSQDEIRRLAVEGEVFIIGGQEYDQFLKNTYILCTPVGQIYECSKIHISKYDHHQMIGGNEINIFIDSGFGDFVPIICYDYTNIDLISKLRGYVDIIIVIASNPDVSTFHSQGINDCWQGYCFVVICNSSNYGGSGVYGPINKVGNQYVEKIVWRTEGVAESLNFVDLPINGLIKGGRYGKYSFKAKPAGYKRKKFDSRAQESRRRAITYQDPHWQGLFREPYYFLKNDESNLYEKFLDEDFLKLIKDNIIEKQKPRTNLKLVSLLTSYYSEHEEILKIKGGEAYDQFRNKLEKEGKNCHLVLACATMKDMQNKQYLPETFLEWKELIPLT